MASKAQQNTTDTSAIVATAVQAQFTRVTVEGEYRRVSVTKAEAFAASATATYLAGKAGVQDKDIAAAVEKEAIDRGLVEKGANGKPRAIGEDGAALYMSATAIGFHRRTGHFLSLDGDLPEGVTAEDVQALVKRVTNRKVKGADNIETNDEILNSAATKAEAFERLQASEMLKAMHDAAPVVEDNGGGDPEVEKAARTARNLLAYCDAIGGPVGKILAGVQDRDKFATFVNVDGVKRLDEVISTLLQAQSMITAVMAENANVKGANAALADAS
jgi:hypothetical protein